ncbi:MBL fold metallo-hydrolase [Marinibaculum pumilum]|uniref:MBL fold metallo-hydrolase n=1 Tax=Marinibaculum pumilum TaxID=1766165 RepID=A0ABV7L869_9PROT
MSFKVKFWGVRGSIATPSPRHIAFGGNTSCVEVSVGGRRIVLDAGTGIRNLGHWFLRKDVHHAYLLLSHTHWDHINGFPFFSPAFRKDRHFQIMAGHLTECGGIRPILSNQMTQPWFPVPIDVMSARLEYEDFRQGDSFTLGRGIQIRTAALNHPNGATGYRIEHAGKSLCYVTDTEHVPGRPDQNVLGLIEGADLVIYDCTYTDKEFEGKIGWGHSTWQEGIRLCQQANVKTLAIFHHDPDHEDHFMERLEADARSLWTGAIVARENMRINLA